MSRALGGGRGRLYTRIVEPLPDAEAEPDAGTVDTDDEPQPALTPIESVSETLGARIRYERRAASLTVRGLAGRIGVSPSLISQVERGRATPSVATLWAIATELGIPVGDLFSDSQFPARARAERGAIVQ